MEIDWLAADSVEVGAAAVLDLVGECPRAAEAAAGCERVSVATAAGLFWELEVFSYSVGFFLVLLGKGTGDGVIGTESERGFICTYCTYCRC